MLCVTHTTYICMFCYQTNKSEILSLTEPEEQRHDGLGDCRLGSDHFGHAQSPTIICLYFTE